MSKRKVEQLAKKLGVVIDDDGEGSIYVEAPLGEVWDAVSHYYAIGTYYGLGAGSKAEAWADVAEQMSMGLRAATPEEDAERRHEQALD